MAETIDLATSRRARKAAKRNAVKPPPKYSQRTGVRGFVQAMKILLPLAAVVMIAAAVVWPQLNPVDGEWSFSIPILSQQDGLDNTTMLRVSFEGRDSRDQPFRITADSAEERDGDDSIIDLSDLAADITLRDGAWVALTAQEGVYSKDARTLEIQGGVNLFQDEGYELSTERATISLDSGDVRSATPVQGQGPFGLITAEGLEVLEEGQIIRFTGHAELDLEPGGLGGLE